MKKFLFYFTCLLVLLFLVGNAYAASTRAGKRKFKKYCYKKCHKHGEIIITPTYYTSEQWDELFKDNYEKLKEIHINGELDNLRLKPKHYNNIRVYLKKHSLDSEQPETCG